MVGNSHKFLVHYNLKRLGILVDFRLAKCASRNCTVFGCPFQHSMVNSTFNVGDGRKFGCFQMEELKKAKQPEKIGQNETLVDIDEVKFCVKSFN